MEIILENNFITRYHVDLHYLDQGGVITQSCHTSSNWRRLSERTYSMVYNTNYQVKGDSDNDVIVYHGILDLTCIFDDLRTDAVEIIKKKGGVESKMESFIKQNVRNVFHRIQFPSMQYALTLEARTSISNELIEHEMSSIKRAWASTPVDELPTDFQRIIANPPAVAISRKIL
ncbi:hypothetical protein WG906_06065 [Pedobacter sp. P351]|uniref:hypothetical protein n=1 Tax=Pedobacter superstes TaxID=3133441 RepID=UPI0030995C2B